ncbi:LysR family transcriptional regulator [Oricola cellulosilytica]|uniref:LysR family transcriptional regulator n=1 Tax=Oricola cellulosilytica TaxID=1429082 RepID=A0A4R0PD98_9HYPH|nr:LysR family transcriptional regulator [Oricola cellulosilytica]TCD15462.1 LysR family transcriptional regulator [Oricola cellulosilytica]
MNWQAITFDWNQVRAFLATVEEGSLSAAARVLGLTQPTVGRQISALEAELGVVLFARAGRAMALTPSGQELVQHVQAMGEAATRLSLAASGQAESIEGQLRITASDVMSAHVLPPVLLRLQAVAPLLEIDLVAANDVRDLLRREADIAIRHVRPHQPDLIARLVREASAYFYASSGYLERRGVPRSLEDLTAHNFISFGDAGQMIEHFEPLGLSLTTANFRHGSKSGVVAWELVKHGLGIGIMSQEVAEATPGLERLLPDMAPVVFPVWLVTHRELHTSRRIRLAFDMLGEFLSDPGMRAVHAA